MASAPISLASHALPSLLSSTSVFVFDGQHRPLLCNVHRHRPINVRTYPFPRPNEHLSQPRIEKSRQTSIPCSLDAQLGLPGSVPKHEILLVGDRPPFHAHPALPLPISPDSHCPTQTRGRRHLGFKVIAFTVVVPQRDRARSDSDSRCARRTGTRVPCRCERRPGRKRKTRWQKRPRAYPLVKHDSNV